MQLMKEMFGVWVTLEGLGQHLQTYATMNSRLFMYVRREFIKMQPPGSSGCNRCSSPELSFKTKSTTTYNWEVVILHSISSSTPETNPLNSTWFKILTKCCLGHFSFSFGHHLIIKWELVRFLVIFCVLVIFLCIIINSEKVLKIVRNEVSVAWTHLD